VPPDDGISLRPEDQKGEKMIVPRRVQLPPPGTLASVRATGVPPESGTTLSFPSTKNPTLRLSGEKNGLIAPSVPAKGTESNAPISRRKS
jgi:hypothetical protein